MAFRLDPAALARQRRLNRLHSALLLLSLSGLAGWTGLLVGGPEGLAFGAGMVLAFLLLSPMPGDALFRHAFGAVRLSPAQAPDLSALLAALAHEVAHIRHGDLRVLRLATAAATLTRGMAGIGALLLLALLPALWASGMAPSPLALLLLMAAPIISDLLTLSLSRRREFLADAGAVELTGDVVALAEALARLWRLQGDDWERLASRAPRWLRWFRTHPTVGDRIAALRSMAAPVRAPWPEPDRIAVVPGALWSLGGHHPAQRLARRWLL